MCMRFWGHWAGGISLGKGAHEVAGAGTGQGWLAGLGPGAKRQLRMHPSRGAELPREEAVALGTVRAQTCWDPPSHLAELFLSSGRAMWPQPPASNGDWHSVNVTLRKAHPLKRLM